MVSCGLESHLGHGVLHQLALCHKGLDEVRPSLQALKLLELGIQLADALDAAVCILCALDFTKGLAVGPENSEVARKEGWIWVK